MNSSPNNIKGGVTNSNTPLLLFQPFNIVVFLTFFSPIILAISIVSLSFIFQNFKGFIYLGFLLAGCILRNFFYMYSGTPPIVHDDTICSTIQYTKYGNSSFSIFVFAFTIMYISLPMFVNGGANYWVFTALLVYSIVDICIKVYKGCIMKTSAIFVNMLSGLAFGALIVTAMYSGGSGQYLFFNEVSSNKEICSMPKKQTFKCAVYKNGELIGNSIQN
jgi:hypothetical protein